MKNCEKILLKSPIPVALIEYKQNKMIIKMFNLAYRLMMSKENDEILEKYLTDKINEDDRKDIQIYKIIELNQKKYNMQINKFDEGKYVLWILAFDEENIDPNSDNMCLDLNYNEVEKNKDIDNYYSFIFHEIKNPLSMILGTSQLIERKVAEHLYERQILSHIDLIKQNCFRILKIINNISYKTKLESGYLVYNPTNENIVTFIEGICKSVIDLANINNMKIIFNTDSEELIVGFDGDKIEKIILNLISNAFKYRKENGGAVLVDLSHDEEKIYIRVVDNGIGISSNDLKRVFNKYERLRDNKSIAKEGTGIGLCLVKSFAQMHGGDITVDSEYGLWTEFLVTISNTLSQSKNSENYVNKEERKRNIKVAFSDI